MQVPYILIWMQKLLKKTVFYFNKTDIRPSIFDGGHENYLSNWYSYKRSCVHLIIILPVDIPMFYLIGVHYITVMLKLQVPFF